MNASDDIARKRRWTDIDAERYHKGTGAYADRIDTEIVVSALGGRRGLALDMPCGSGRINAIMREHLPTIGADYSESMLHFAVHKAGVTGVRVDAFRLGFRDSAFSVAVCLRLSFHYPDCREILAELARVTEAGGLVVIDSLNPYSMRRLINLPWSVIRGARAQAVVFRSRATFQRMIEESGFRVVDVQSRYILPTRAYRLLPRWACAMLEGLEGLVPSPLRVVTYWRLEKTAAAGP